MGPNHGAGPLGAGVRAGCAAQRLTLGEPLVATAPERIHHWFLVEHPGPWPLRGFPADLPTEVAQKMQAADALGIRTQLIRPVHQRRRQPSTIIVAGTTATNRWLERREITDAHELVDLDLDAVASGRAPGFGEPASPEASPVVLVCTHGRRDVCCARLGRPLAVALDRALPGQVCESSHLGGDRFAANVVSLPDGIYHGGLTSADVDALADALRSGRVLLPHLRGQAGRPAAIQAAEHFLRVHLGLVALDAVRHDGSVPSTDGTTAVDLLGPDGSRHRVTVRSQTLETERLTSCADGGVTGTPTTFHLVNISDGQPPGVGPCWQGWAASMAP